MQLEDWVAKSIPKDVVEVELFIKDSESPNVYSVDSLNYKSDAWNRIGTGKNKGSYEINSVSFKNALESNQLLRPFDSVPKTALAQEVVANRLVYGNYVIDYDLIDKNGNEINIDFTTSVGAYQDSIIYEEQDLSTPLPTYEDYLNGKNNGKPRESIKSIRTYQVGIVYRDDFGRETPVLVCEGSSVTVPKDSAILNSRISVQVNNLPPYWATSYKFFVKDAYDPFRSMELRAYSFPGGDGLEVPEWIADSIDNDSWTSTSTLLDTETGFWENPKMILHFQSKFMDFVTAGDTLVQKIANGGYPGSTLPTAFSIVGKETNPALSYEVQQTNVINGALTDSSFKNVVESDFSLIKNSGVSAGVYPNTVANDLILPAYFETLPPQRVDVDLYYEASQAYPITLSSKTDEQHIKIGRLVTFSMKGPNGESIIDYDYINNFGDIDSTIYPYLDGGGDPSLNSLSGIGDADVNPSYKNKWEIKTVETFGNADSTLEYTKILVKDRYTGEAYDQENYGDIDPGNYVVLTFVEDGEFVTGKGQAVSMRVKEFLGNGEILLYKQTHPTTLNPGISLPITLPWFNCYSFGDGREVMYLGFQLDAAKLDKGVKASTTVSEYSEKKVTSGLIYSGPANKFSGLNSLNQFISFLGITKELNPKHGSIQKLHAKETNLIALCENKILNILAEKDVLYNADSTTNLAAINQVLGSAVAYEGDYGISRNPESFASHTYRSYFTDKARGAVLRLSKDGITPISEAGMSNYFKKELRANSGNIVGGYNKDKDEYELTIGDKNVVFDETIDGWVSFRSYLNSTQPVSIDRFYYTFEGGKMWEQDADSMEAGRCNFFGEQYTSSITTTFNQNADTVKTFKTMSLEGSNAKPSVTSDYAYNQQSPLSSVAQGDTTQLEAENNFGWSIDYLQTDIEKGTVNSFVRREGKEFGYIQGVLTEEVSQLELATGQGVGTPSVTSGDGSFNSDIYYTYEEDTLVSNHIRVRGAANECISVGDDLFYIMTVPGSFNAFVNSSNNPSASNPALASTAGMLQFLLGVISNITTLEDFNNLWRLGNYDSLLLGYDETGGPIYDTSQGITGFVFPAALYAQTKSVNAGDIIGYYCDVKLSNNSLTRAELFSISAGVQISSK